MSDFFAVQIGAASNQQPYNPTMPSRKRYRPGPQMEYRCIPCRSTFPTFELLSNHLNEEHSCPEQWECDTCHHTHGSMEGLRQHLTENTTPMRTRKAERRNRADIKQAPEESETANQEQQENEKEFPGKETARQRRKRLDEVRRTRGKYCLANILEQAESGKSDGELIGKWICRSCSSTFPNVNPLTKHLLCNAIHSESSGTRGRCQTCNQRFRSFKLFKAHFLQNPTHMRILVRGSSNSEHMELNADVDEAGEMSVDKLGEEDESTDDLDVDSEEKGTSEDDDNSDVSTRDLASSVSRGNDCMEAEDEQRLLRSDSDSDSDLDSDSDFDSDSDSSSDLDSESGSTSIDQQAEQPTNRVEQHKPPSTDKWYPGKLARASPPKLITAGSLNDATTCSPTVEAASVATATPANPRFPRLQPVNVLLHVPATPPRTPLQTREDCQQLETMIAAITSVNQKQRDISFSDDCGSGTDSESEEDLIELGEIRTSRKKIMTWTPSPPSSFPFTRRLSVLDQPSTCSKTVNQRLLAKTTAARTAWI